MEIDLVNNSYVTGGPPNVTILSRAPRADLVNNSYEYVTGGPPNVTILSRAPRADLVKNSYEYVTEGPPNVTSLSRAPRADIGEAQITKTESVQPHHKSMNSSITKNML